MRTFPFARLRSALPALRTVAPFARLRSASLVACLRFGLVAAIFGGASSVLTSCHSTKAPTVSTADTDAAAPMRMLKRTVTNRQTAEFVSAKLKFSAAINNKDVSVDGVLRMKRDDVIRIQLQALGVMEVGRLEFTPDYVLIMDRVNKQYIKAPYADVDFLRSSGITFYTLQSLFWNELFQPGRQTPELETYTLSPDGQNLNVAFQRDKLSYQWVVEQPSALIRKVSATHSDTKEGNATLNWDYADFQKLEGHPFPCNQQVTFAAKNRTLKMGFRLSSPTTDSDWETRTKVSSRYDQVTVEEVLSKIAALGN